MKLRSFSSRRGDSTHSNGSEDSAHPSPTPKKGYLPTIEIRQDSIVDSGITINITDPADYLKKIDLLVEIINRRREEPRPTLIKIAIIGHDESIKINALINSNDLYIQHYQIAKEEVHSPYYTTNEGQEKYPNNFTNCSLFAHLCRISTTLSSPDWLTKIATVSLDISNDLIHTLGIYIAEAIRFAPMKAYVARNLSPESEIDLTVVPTNSKGPLMVKNKKNKEHPVTYGWLIRNWALLSQSLGLKKGTRIFRENDRINITSEAIQVALIDYANTTRVTSGIVSTTVTPERATTCPIEDRAPEIIAPSNIASLNEILGKMINPDEDTYLPNLFGDDSFSQVTEGAAAGAGADYLSPTDTKETDYGYVSRLLRTTEVTNTLLSCSPPRGTDGEAAAGAGGTPPRKAALWTDTLSSSQRAESTKVYRVDSPKSVERSPLTSSAFNNGDHSNLGKHTQSLAERLAEIETLAL